MAEQMTKATLLERLQAEDQAFQAVLSPLSEAQMTTSGITPIWSIKDVLAHLNAWERYVLNRLQAALHGTEPTFIETDEDEDRVNAQFYEEARPLSLNAVLAAFHDTRQQMLETLQALSDADLATPGRFLWLDGGTLWELARTDPHSEEHRLAVQAWLQGQEGG